MSEEFLSFQKFPQQEDALELVKILAKKNIVADIEDTSKYFDPTFAYNKVCNYFVVKIKGKDFNHANEVIDSIYSKQIENAPPDYYLYDFDDTELADIIKKPDEWGRFDYLFAQKLLKERGRNLNDSLVASLRNERFIALSKPHKTRWGIIISGYILSVLGGFLGLAIALIILNSKRTLPNGRTFYSYNDEERNHAKTMIVIFIVAFIGFFVLRNYLKHS